MWEYTGQKRPPFAKIPGDGQESVWDYPRPPVLRSADKEVVVRSGEKELARTFKALRLLETASPPGYYLPVTDIDMELLQPVDKVSFCEWKGMAVYWKLAADPQSLPVGWSYPDPSARYARLKDHLSFYPGRVDCFVEGEKVIPQAGQFYGGWITGELTGPFKGAPGTGHW